MATRLKKVTNIGVKCGAVGVPLIKAVIETDSPNDVVTSALLQEVYNSSSGMVSGIAMQVNHLAYPNLLPAAIRNLTAGTYTYGDTSGFSITFVVRSWGGTTNAVYPTTIRYKGNVVGSASVWTGYAPLECCYLVVFVDENNHIYTVTGDFTGLYVLMDIDPGIAAPDNVPYAPVLPGYDLMLRAMGANVTATSNDITNDIENEIDPSITDPYEQGGGESGPGGGTGTFSETGDTVGIPGLPTLSAVDTGFITLFNPSAAQVKALANYMWSASFDLATFKNIVANPIDCILGLSIVPVNPPNAGSKVVTVGNIPTDVTLPYLSSQYVEVDCGTLNVQEFWGSYLDYSPYTKMSLYLPYIGIIPLDIDDVMNASIAIKYHVDVLSGACVAYVLCNGTQLYTYVGQCSSNVPITSTDFTNTVNGILGIAGSIGKLAADGGASAPTAIAEVAANAINALKPNIQKSGAMSGTGGLMGVQTPYLICQRPRQSVAHNQNLYTGYPANITATLSDLSGYTEVESIHLDGLSATQEEQQEIMDLLTSGVII